MPQRRSQKLYFFLSYARGDDNTQVEQLFRDLSREVRVHAGVGGDEEVGFLDMGLEVGAIWPPRLMDALSRCHTFVALLSPGYVASVACGREWAVFADRQRRYQEAAGVPLSTLLPLRWLPPRRLPQEISDWQYDNTEFPESYRTKGLRQLMRLERHRDAYLEVISELAQQIVDLADYALPPAIPRDFRDVISVFANINEARNPEPGEPLRRRRTHDAHFVVVAPSNDDLRGPLAAKRRQRMYYGHRPTDWSPYLPAHDMPVADLAQSVAHQRGFKASVADTTTYRQVVTDAVNGHQLVVLLVDPWSPHKPRHRAALTVCDQLDRDDHDSMTIMIPASYDDTETQDNWPDLYAALKALLVKGSARGDGVRFRANILSHSAFEADLLAILESYRNRVFSTTTVERPISGPSSPRPILEGP